jgi:hypothetical protein
MSAQSPPRDISLRFLTRIVIEPRLTVVLGTDVISNKVLQRFQLLEEFLWWYLFLDGVATQDVRRRVDRSPPRDLVGSLLVHVDVSPRQRLDRIEVDVGKGALLRLVEVDLRSLALGGDRLFRDRLFEGRVFPARVIGENKERLSGLRLARLDALDDHDRF